MESSKGSGMAESCDHAKWVRHLLLIARELRELGIAPEIVILSEEGVTPAGMTLPDEVELVAMNIDFAEAMRFGAEQLKEIREQQGGQTDG